MILVGFSEPRLVTRAGYFHPADYLTLLPAMRDQTQLDGYKRPDLTIVFAIGEPPWNCKVLFRSYSIQ